jgi:hypothetical protein
MRRLRSQRCAFRKSSDATRYVWCMLRLRHFVLLVTLSMTLAEFIEVQQLAPADLRTRFGLSQSCDPSVMASTTDPAANVVTVAIHCRANPATTSSPAEAFGQRQPDK